MAKTMRNIVIACIVFIAIAVGASALVMTGGFSALAENPFGNALNGARTGAVNTLIDTSGIKDRIDSELRVHAGEIAEFAGIPTPILEEGIESLAIREWEAVDKPSAETASSTGTYTIDAQGTQVGITTYDDPSIVTVQAYGQEVTLKVPESAQMYTDLLPLLEYAQ